MTLKESLRISTSRRKGEESWTSGLKASILVPLYNTPEDFLRQMIRSVQGQTCGNWELCLADASDNPEVGQVVEEFAEADTRIRYRKLERNLGISGNTNAALEMATGEVIALLDHDDVLHPSAVHAVLRAVSQGADFAYTDEITFDSESGELTIRNYKPDFDPFCLLGANYICHFSAFRRELLDRAGGGFRAEYDGSQDHDLILRLTEQAQEVVHVKEALYFWRAHGGSVARTAAVKSYAIDAGHRAVAAALKRRGLSGSVESTRQSPTMYRIRYDLPVKEKVSILILTRDHGDDLATCVESVFRLTTYPDYEVVVIDNGSANPASLAYLEKLVAEGRVRIIRHDVPFNYSELTNFGVRQTTGKYVVLLNNDIEVITPGWLEEMVAFARLPEVGAVGAKLYYPDGTIQHAGVVVGFCGVAGHAFAGCAHDDPGTSGRMIVAHEYSAVTAACLMVRREAFDRAGGFEPQLAVAFNDVDFCLRLRELGYHNVWTPFAELYHCESKSRGSDLAPDKIRRFMAEQDFFKARWTQLLMQGDPFYHPKFKLDGKTFEENDLPGQESDSSSPDRQRSRTSGSEWGLKEAVLRLMPYGVVCAWKRRRHGIVEDLPLFHYPGLSKRIRRIVKFSLPYGLVSLVKLPFDLRDAQSQGNVSVSGVECLGGLAGLSGVPAGLTRALRPKVLIVAELVIAQLRYYRVEQKVCMLRKAGIAVEVESWTDVAACVRGLQTATCVIVYRAPYSKELKAIYAEARRLGLRIAYDTDDLVFEESAMKANPAFANLSAAERRKLVGMARPYREALAAADFPIASTAALAEAMSRHCRGRTHIVPNAICEELLSPPFRYPTAVGGEVVIGYGAGSATHAADFGQCAGALVRVLEKFPGTVLVIHGSLVLPREFDRFVARIRRVPFVPFSEYANALARLDINLIPLERNLFNDCKSNIKYLEASRLGVVSVASPCAEFASVIRNGENGFLAADEQEWYEALSRLVSDADLRRRMGEAARRTVHERFDGDVVWRTCLQPALDDLTVGRPMADRRILCVTDGDGRPPSSDKGEIVSVLSLTDDKRIAFPVRTERNGCNGFRVPVGELAALDEVLDAIRPDEVLFDRVGYLEAAGLVEAFAKRGIPYAIVIRDGWWLCPMGRVPGADGCPGRPDGVVDLYTCAACCADCKNLFLRWNRLTSALKGAKVVRAADAALRDVYRANGMTVN